MVTKKKDKDLHCYGCAHSGAGDPFPGEPSGERPCHFCIRNSKLQNPPKIAHWYNLTDPVKVPMDCYHTIDMKDQFRAWEAELNKMISELKKKLNKVQEIVT